jgi:hypothetical protein
MMTALPPEELKKITDANKGTGHYTAKSTNPYTVTDPRYKQYESAWATTGTDHDKQMALWQGGESAMKAALAPAAAPSAPVAKMPAPKADAAYTGGLRNVDGAVQYDNQGRPIRNDYLSTTGEDGKMLGQYSISDKIGADVQLDQAGLNAMKARALGTGPSAWAGLAEQKQRLEESGAMNQANRKALSTQNQQYAQLAGRGGLSAGQRERLAMQTARNQFSGGQNVMNQGQTARLNIGLQDQQQKDQFLSQLPGQELNAANFNQGQRAYRDNALNIDIGRALQDAQGQNAYRSGTYDSAMKEWGAEKQSQAMAKSSGGGKK